MRQWLGALVLLVLVGCSRYSAFDQYYDQQDWSKALEVLSSLPQKNTYAYKIREYKIVLRLAFSGDTNAITRLRTLLNEQEDTRLAGYRDLGRLFLLFLDNSQQRLYDAVVSNGEPLSRFPEEFRADASFLLGVCYLSMDQAEQAKAYLKKSYSQNARWDTLYFLGMAYLLTGDEALAVSSWRQILSAKPGGLVEAMAYFQMGEILYQKGHFSEALPLYFEAVNIYPDSEIFADKIGFCYQKLKKKKLSEKFRKIALRINKDYATAWFYLNFN